MIGRFQVMGLLQAARAYTLGYPVDEAQSFGLNRAIFYAAAKEGFKGGSTTRAGNEKTYKVTPWEREQKKIYADAIGNETAYYVDLNGKKRFVMGNQVLTPKEFHRQIEEKFGNEYEKAWREALSLVKGTDRETLESQRKFYEQVYKPHRDEIAAHYSDVVSSEA